MGATGEAVVVLVEMEGTPGDVVVDTGGTTKDVVVETGAPPRMSWLILGLQLGMLKW